MKVMFRIKMIYLCEFGGRKLIPGKGPDLEGKAGEGGRRMGRREGKGGGGEGRERRRKGFETSHNLIAV